MKNIVNILLVCILIGCKPSTGEIKTNNTIEAEAIKHNNKGLEFVSVLNENVDSAFYYFDRAIEIDSNYASPHSNKANLFITLGDKKNALKELKIVTELNPEIGESWVLYGIALDYYGHKKESKLAYQQGVKLLSEKIENTTNDQERDNNLLNRGCALFLLGDPKYNNDFEELKDKESFKMHIDELTRLSKEDFLEKLMKR